MNPIAPYNTQQADVKLPEYGRNVQRLVTYCMTIPDRKKRTACAKTIVGIMADIYPEMAVSEDSQHILWDHLARLSGYKLDVDYPYPIVPEEERDARPEPLSPSRPHISLRMYGRVVEDMIQKACEETDQQRRIALFELCANHMKLCYYQTYPNAEEDDNKIINDVLYYTRGEFVDDVFRVYLYTLKELQENNQYDPAKLVVTKKKKKKKKKK